MTAPARILLAEDDRILRKAGEIALRKNGYQVIVAVDGEDALAKARTESPDLILLDVMMPKFDGFEVLAQLKADAATRDIPVIMLTANPHKYTREEAESSGAAIFLTKPFSPTQLLEEIRKHTLDSDAPQR